MHNHGHFANALSISLHKNRQDIEMFFLYRDTIEGVQEKIANYRDKFLVLVGQDESRKYIFDPLDNWEYLDRWAQKPLVIDVDYLAVDNKPYNRLHRVWFNQNTMANIETLLMHQPIMHIQYTKGPWLSLMHGLHEHRVYTFEHYISKIKHNFVYSYGQQAVLGHEYNDHDFPFGPEIYNNNNLVSLLPYFNQCGGSVVSETCKDFTLTEKTFQAIMAGHPFLLIGIKGSIQYLRHHGFDVFDDLLNHDYDRLDDLYDRIDRLFADNTQILSTKIDRYSIADRLEKNRWQLWRYRDRVTGDLFQKIVDIYSNEPERRA